MPLSFHSDLPMFFFGTLMDADVREAVLGHSMPAEALEPARLSGWKRVSVAGRAYPMLVAHPTGSVDGILAQGLSEQDRQRLDHYEGPEYRTGILALRLLHGNQEVNAAVYLCHAGIIPSREEWRLETWQLRHKRTALSRIRSIMAGWRSSDVHTRVR